MCGVYARVCMQAYSGGANAVNPFSPSTLLMFLVPVRGTSLKKLPYLQEGEVGVCHITTNNRLWNDVNLLRV